MIWNFLFYVIVVVYSLLMLICVGAATSYLKEISQALNRLAAKHAMDSLEEIISSLRGGKKGGS